MEPLNEGLAALRRLWEHANGCTGQCRYTAAFLLGIYDGARFRFDLTSLRGIDQDLFIDCIRVLVLDRTPEREVHRVLGVKGECFEELARRWGMSERADV